MFIVDIVDNCCALRSHLKIKTERICLELMVLVILRFYLVFVRGAFIGARNENLPYARLSKHSHWMPSSVPVIEVTHHAHIFCIRRPYRKMNAFYALDNSHMRAKFLVILVMGTLSDQVQIKFCQDWRKVIWVIKFLFQTVPAQDPYPVLSRFSIPYDGLEEALFMQLLHLILFFLRITASAFRYYPCRLCLGKKSCDSQSIFRFMRTKNFIRLAVICPEKLFDMPGDIHIV